MAKLYSYSDSVFCAIHNIAALKFIIDKKRGELVLWRDRKEARSPIKSPTQSRSNKILHTISYYPRHDEYPSGVREVPLPDHDGSILDDVADAPECEGIAVFRNDVLDTHHTLSIS